MAARRGSSKRKGYIAPGRRDVYDAIRREGGSKEKAARIANYGTTRGKRSAMSRKGAATRRAKRR